MKVFVGFGVAALAALALAACGSGNEGDSSADGAKVGAAPTEEVVARDGETVHASVGDEFAVRMELPDGVSTEVEWRLVEGENAALAEIAEFKRTWHAMQGEQRYSELEFTAIAPGEASAVFEVADAGNATNEARRTLTFVVAP